MSSAQGGGGGQQSSGGAVGEYSPMLSAAFAAGGEMGARMRDLDWLSTPVGRPDSWPSSLRHAISSLLTSRAQICMFWGDDYLAFYNDAYLPTIGDKHPTALAAPAREHWSEMWQDVLGPLLGRVRRTGRAFQGRDHPFLLNRYGFLEETYFDVSYDPLRGEDGEIGGLYCICTETTGRVLGERRLRALTTLGSRLAVASSPAELGQAASQVFDDHRADIPFALLYLTEAETGPAYLISHSGVDRELVRVLDHTLPPALRDCLAGGPAALADTTDFLRAAPPLAAPQTVVLPIMAATEPAGALVVGVSERLALTDEYRDFFDLVASQISTAVGRQRAYEQQRARAAELAALDQAKTDFFANVSHEFRTPLTLVLGPLEDLLGDAAVPALLTGPLTVMHRNALRLLKLVNTVLDFSRLESGRSTAHFVPTDLADYTTRLASTFRSAVERAGLRLVVDCPPLPEPVLVDRDMWEKIVLNLLSNALKFTFSGEIRVRTRAVDGMAELVVSDTGVGITPDELPQIFERFHRVAGVPSRSHEGTGIGLALVRELAGMHRGRVTARSRVNEGSAFTVHVPFGARHLPAERIGEQPVTATVGGRADLYVAETGWWATPRAQAEPVPPPSAGTGESKGVARVLVADDNADLREYVTRLLAPYWEVVAVADGAAALDVAVRTPFDLVLTDVMMPRLDGFGLVSALRADPRTRHVPIVLLSARAGSAEEVAGLATGADDYLVKPFAAQELIARVRANVELGQLRGQIIRQLRALADAAVAVNTARSTAEVLQVAAWHASALVEAGRVVVTAPGSRYEVDGGGRTPDDPSAVFALPGTGGDRLGELRVWPREGEHSDTELAALDQLARLVGVRLENARLYETEHRIATTLQHSLLPRTLPHLPGAIVAGRYLPGSADVEVGGDWYDAIRVGQELVLVIGDVVGKGVPAAAAMGQLRNALRAYILEGYDPGQALTRLNRLVVETERRSFATVVCLSFDPRTGGLRYASAGHPAPILIREGDVSFLYRTALGPPVGALPEVSYATVTGRLEPGWRLLLYTDGLVEDRTLGIDEGMAQLRAVAATPFGHVDDLVSVMVDRVAGRPRRDDVAVLALEATALNRFALRLPADPTRLSLLRSRLEDFLIAHDVSENDLFDLTLAVSEAAANAIEHPVEPAESHIDVEVTIADRTVTATVRDSGRWREPGEAGFRGRGLALIGALSEVAVTRTGRGTEVTLRRQVAP